MTEYSVFIFPLFYFHITKDFSFFFLFDTPTPMREPTTHMGREPACVGTQPTHMGKELVHAVRKLTHMGRVQHTQG